MRTMDSYDTVRDVIAVCYQSRHITNFKTVDTGGPAPMDVGAGALWRKDAQRWTRQDGPPTAKEVKVKEN